MHSFTPFFNPNSPFLESSLFSWLSLTSWNPGSFMIMNIKNNIQLSNEKTISQPIIERKSSLINEKTQCNMQEDEYQPQKQIPGFQIQQRKNCGRIQCKGRNDYSNILKAFIHLVKTNNTLKEKIKFIIQRKGLALTYEKFLLKIRRKFSKGKTYISPKQILIFLKTCNQCTDESEKAIGDVFKISLKGFLSLQYVLCLIKSFKGKKQSRKELITKTRQLTKIIFQQGLINQNF